MADTAKIQTLHDNTTGEAVAPRTVVKALSGDGAEGQLLGFTSENTVGLITPDATPTQGSNKPVQSGGVYDEIGKLATKGYVGEQIDDIAVGGTNIFRGSNVLRIGSGGWSTSEWQSYTGDDECIKADVIQVSNAPSANIHAGVRVTNPDGISTYNGIGQEIIPIPAGNTYTISCYARVTNGSGSCRCQMRINNIEAASTYFSSTTLADGIWTQYSFTHTIPNEASVSSIGAQFYLVNTIDETTMEICGMKLEVGNKATDWSPSPDDMQPAIFDSNGNVQLPKENLQKLAEALKGYLE